MSNGVLEGKFNDGRSGVVLDGDLEDAVTFAIWFRSMAPSQQNLLFYDEQCLVQVDLKVGATERDVVRAVQNTYTSK